ncbi:lipase 3-like [Plodia interpunctella]|uniref:lipase 3-like n=1 Tax=Plodia interpunctella TaxID=58824 RepID=UPI002368184D|nr:lipase 3-like [Plodia interpunctella]
MIRGTFLISLLMCGYSLPAGREEKSALFEVPEIIKSNGYQSERHHVITPDGYILEMHRIPFGRHQTTSEVRRPVVFLMHGLLTASNSYIVLGPEHSISYNLADAGFDVWMGNARGNRLSRRHTTLDPDVDKSEFFDFSWEEIGMIDVAAMIDYVLEFTGEEKLHYVGHSQGGTSFLVLASMRPEYNEKLSSVNLLAGVGYMNHFPNKHLGATALLTDVIYVAASAVGFVEVYPPDFDRSLPWGRTAGTDRCTGNLETQYMCDLIGVRHLVRENESVSGTSDFLDIGGAALKQIAHYGQNIRDKAFRRWNYGLIQNLRIYGKVAPPAYDLSLITANVTMHYTVNDNLLDERDVLAMAADMPNTVVRKVARDTFLHEDFVLAKDVKELVTDFMIESMLQIEHM